MNNELCIVSFNECDISVNFVEQISEVIKANKGFPHIRELYDYYGIGANTISDRYVVIMRYFKTNGKMDKFCKLAKM